MTSRSFPVRRGADAGQIVVTDTIPRSGCGTRAFWSRSSRSSWLPRSSALRSILFEPSPEPDVLLGD